MDKAAKRAEFMAMVEREGEIPTGALASGEGATKPIVSGCMHIYAQPFNHAPAFIAGTMDQLRALRDTIDRVLSTGRAQLMETMAADGEGYDAVVMPREDMSEDMLPYADPPAPGMRWTGSSPLAALTREDYERMRQEQE